MADRPHPYPMFPQNLPPNPLQHPQIPQQPPQSQQPDPQMISALSNPEHSRMWQQMNQLQSTFRPHQLGDLAASQMNHQIHEFAQGQAVSHGQGQAMVRQMQQIQQPFGMNAQRMNPSAPLFHDPQANLSQFLMSSNSPNAPMNTPQQMKTPFNMNPMMHATLGNNPGISRQIKMLNQPEMARLQQPGLGAQHAPNQQTAVDMFASSSMQPSQDQMHGSPHPAAQPVGPPGANQGMVPGNQQVKKMQVEFQEKRARLHNSVVQCENNLTLLQTRNPASMDPQMQQNINQLRNELANRKDTYNKFISTYGAIMTQQMANSMNGVPSNIPHINPVAHSSSQQPPQPTASTSQVQPGFVTQANQPVTSQYNIANGPSPMPTQNQATLNQQLPIAAAQIGRPNTIPPRTGGTPHQIPGGQLANNMSPNMGNFTPQGGQKVPNQSQARQSVGGIMPLDKLRFDSTYAQFCRSQNITATLPGLRVPIGDNSSVDLHQLHTSVMQEGGASQVTARDMWAVIGGRLGFVHFPGNESEPARAGPGFAQQLHNAYEKYLQHFENAYILTVRNRTGTGSPQQPINQMNPNSVPISNNATPGMSGNPTEIPPNAPRPNFNPQVIATALRYVHMNAQDMRAQRVPDQLIAFVERHRPELQKVYQQQLAIAAKRNAEQGQQNNANAQGQPPNVPESSIGLQPGGPRPHPTVGPSNMINMPSGDTKMVNGSFPSDNIAAAAALNLQPPTQEQLHHAMLAINQLKVSFQQRTLPGMTMHQVPDDHRMEYNQNFEQLYKMASDLDGKLPFYYAVIKNDDFLRKFVAIVISVGKQRQLLSNASPQYIIPLSNLRFMQMQIHKLNEDFSDRWRAMKMFAAANSQQHAQLAPTNNARIKNSASPHAVPPVQNMSQTPLHVPQNNGRQVSLNPSSSQQTHLHPPPSHGQIQPLPAPPHTQPNQTQPQPSPAPQPTKKPFPSVPPSPSAAPNTASITSPTPPPPVASSSTPATSAPTPQTAAGSPQTPKSPPSKAATKTKATRISRKLSTASKGPATPETAPPSVVGVKRPPEEDVSTFASVAPSEAEACNAPSPKKAKTEWEGEMSEALIQRQRQLDSVKTDEDAIAIFDSFKELYAMTATTDNGIHLELASTLDQILAGVAQEPADAAATAAALSLHGAGDAGPPPSALSPHMGPLNDAFSEFFDFSRFTTLEDEDSDSKAPTPDLVPSSETNPSPESGSEGDSLGNAGSPDKTKIEELGGYSDPLRLGSFGEIDGGESAYYQTDNWKWEGSMHTLDQPWAISTS